MLIQVDLKKLQAHLAYPEEERRQLQHLLELTEQQMALDPASIPVLSVLANDLRSYEQQLRERRQLLEDILTTFSRTAAEADELLFRAGYTVSRSGE